MRTPLMCALAATLVLAVGCSRDGDKAPAETPAATAPADGAAPVAASQKVFSNEEVVQMVAPFALYPDQLVAQILMASTYPGDVADAAAWSKAHPDATGDAAVKAVANEPWDPSVQALMAFPQALAVLGQDPAWVQKLGDAFLASPEQVMNGIQYLRQKAQASGNLATNEYQQVKSQPAAAPSAPPAEGDFPPVEENIIIEPSDSGEVYVPSYDPNEAYGEWENSSYPPTYYPPPQQYYPMGGALATGLMWGAGIAVADSLWGDTDWDDGDIDIDSDRYNNINVNNYNGGDSWNHNSVNRDGVPYRDNVNRENYGRQLDGANGRSAYRGEDAARAQQREAARSSMADRGVDTGAAARDSRQTDRTGDRDSRQTDRTGDRDTRQGDRTGERDTRQADRGGQDRERAQTQDRQRQQTQDRQRQQTQTNAGARDGARQQQQSRQQPRNDAFAGASQPSSTRQAQQRGGSSRESAQRTSSGGGRSSGGKQTQRSSNPPERSGRGR